VDLKVITCGFLIKSPHSGGPGYSLLVMNVTGQREYSYKIPIFAQTLTGLYLGLPVDRQKKTRRPGGLAGCGVARIELEWSSVGDS
jgi:hypothetical protein